MLKSGLVRHLGEKNVVLLNARPMTLEMEYYLISLGLSSLTFEMRNKIYLSCLVVQL